MHHDMVQSLLADSRRVAAGNGQDGIVALKLEDQAMPDQAPDDQAREFAAAFRGFLDWVHSTTNRDDNEVSALVRDFLGSDGRQHSVVSRELPAFEHVNLQTAIDAWSAREGRSVEVRGIALPPQGVATAAADDTAQAVTRTLLGVGVDPKDLPVGAALTPGPGRAWMAYAHRAAVARITRFPGP
jgi:hypothetical protein